MLRAAAERIWRTTSECFGLYIALFFLMNSLLFSRETSPVIQTTHGKIRGTVLKSLYDELFYAFDGIPYAVPPLGTLRFREPHDIKPWYGIRDCSKPQSKCLQVSSYTKQVEGSEDCLYLNVSVKKVSWNK